MNISNLNQYKSGTLILQFIEYELNSEIDPETKQRTPLLLKVAPDQTESIPEDETQNKKNVKKTDDSSQFIQNEQLITICLAALGVTSTGKSLSLVMRWDHCMKFPLSPLNIGHTTT